MPDKKYHFLYVEDDAISRTVMEMLVMKFGEADLTLFEDSADFLTRLENLPSIPNIIFLDIHIKPYSGFDMLRMIRQHTKFADSIVIALTASVMSEEIEQLKIEGFNGAIAKPLDREKFPELIGQILSSKNIWHIAYRL
jgi:CheY-like chemotaxis protein